LNRDETRIQKLNPQAARALLNGAVLDKVWMSNKLNDSNTRAAFGETVVKITIPQAMASRIETQSFGKLSPGELWGAINPDLLVGAKFEEVPADEIQPMPERKFKVPDYGTP
jgi:hypothetical protein